MKKLNLLKLVPLMLLGAASLVGCNKSTVTKIGVLLPVEHGALNACAKGFEDGLEASGLVKGKDYTITLRNAGGKDADLVSYAKDLVSSSDMTFGLGTGAAQQLKAASIDKGVVNPVLFSAVTDPVGASLVDSLENGKGFVTGTSDAQPIAEQIALIKECLPSASKVGILYTQTETNSVAQAEDAQEAIEALGMTATVKTVTGPTDISTQSVSLCQSGIDALYVPTDNNLAANMSAVKEAANANNVLVVPGEESMLISGGHITLSIDYHELGVRTGKMAAKIIKGEAQAKDLPVTTMSKEECEYLYSSANLAGNSITLPSEVIAKCRDVSK